MSAKAFEIRPRAVRGLEARAIEREVLLDLSKTVAGWLGQGDPVLQIQVVSDPGRAPAVREVRDLDSLIRHFATFRCGLDTHTIAAGEGLSSLSPARSMAAG